MRVGFAVMGALPTSPKLSVAIRSWIDCVWAGSVAIAATSGDNVGLTN